MACLLKDVLSAVNYKMSAFLATLSEITLFGIKLRRACSIFDKRAFGASESKNMVGTRGPTAKLSRCRGMRFGIDINSKKYLHESKRRTFYTRLDRIYYIRFEFGF